MRRFTTIFTLTASLIAAPIFAQTSDNAKLDALFAILAMPEIVDVMRDEGIDYGATLGDDMLPGGASADWNAQVAAIYDRDKMLEQVRDDFAAALTDADLDAMLEFYTSRLGETLTALEVSARSTMIDDEIEQAAIDAAALQTMDETPQYLWVKDFIDANDLIENNVAGSLNTNYAFYMGLIDGGAMPAGVTPQTALQDVIAQQDEIRQSTTEWVYAYLLMAYQPLSDEDLDTYLTFSQTDAGQDLMLALFASYEGMFADISRALGMAAAGIMLTQEL